MKRNKLNIPLLINKMNISINDNCITHFNMKHNKSYYKPTTYYGRWVNGNTYGIKLIIYKYI